MLWESTKSKNSLSDEFFYSFDILNDISNIAMISPRGHVVLKKIDKLASVDRFLAFLKKIFTPTMQLQYFLDSKIK